MDTPSLLLALLLTVAYEFQHPKVYTEVATGGALSERVFLEISPNSQENTCPRFSFLIKIQV